MKNNVLLLLVLLSSIAYGQDRIIEGYTYETGNRGYLRGVTVQVFSEKDNVYLSEVTSNSDGFFSIEAPCERLILKFKKDVFKEVAKTIAYSDEKTFLKVELQRKPGYLFEVTLAEKKENPNQKVDAIKGALIEVYNNTTKTEVLNLQNHAEPHFEVNFEKGNQYTILVRKAGYIAKQMEAYVNVEGCILCFDGVGKVTPGVSDNLTEGGEYGVLLANVELDRLYEGKTLVINNLYYDLDKYFLKAEGKKELDKVIKLMKYNPNLSIELGSHTDARGSDEYNMRLSKNRAESAVNYVRRVGGISKDKIVWKGYGESQILNECVNGVKCEDEVHAMNRRTEIKIIGIETIDEYVPLTKLKQAENMDELIEELLNQEQVFIKEGETLEDKLEGASQVPDETNTNEIEGIEKVESNDDEANKMEEIKEDVAIDLDEAIEQELELEIDSLPLAEMKTESRKTEHPFVRAELSYHVAVHYAPAPVSAENSIYEDFEDVAYYITDRKMFIYYTGNFSTKAKAEEYKKSIARDYPNAYIIQMKDGVKVD